MTLNDIKTILDCEVISGGDSLDVEIISACGSDMMSDVLAYAKDQSILLTGLINPQVVRTADMMDILCIIFVRGKKPEEDVVSLANDRGIALMSTTHRLFTSCGLLWENGLRGNNHDKQKRKDVIK